MVRSGIELYGRGKGSLTRPAEDAPIRPTSDYGQTIADIEAIAASVAERVGVTVGAVRLASVLGPHVPSPLGRLLRMPAVPFSAAVDPPFAVIEHNDAARALVAAARNQLAEPVNVVAPAGGVRRGACRGACRGAAGGRSAAARLVVVRGLSLLACFAVVGPHLAASSQRG